MKSGPLVHFAPKPLHLASPSLGAKANDEGYEGKHRCITSLFCTCVCVRGVLCANTLISLRLVSHNVDDLIFDLELNECDQCLRGINETMRRNA